MAENTIGFPGGEQSPVSPKPVPDRQASDKPPPAQRAAGAPPSETPKEGGPPQGSKPPEAKDKAAVAANAAGKPADDRGGQQGRQAGNPAGDAGERNAGTSLSMSLDVVRNIPVTLTVVLGSISVPVSSLMKMRRGEIIPLNKKVGEPVEILANGKLIARGEIVVLEEGDPVFAVSLTELVASRAPNPQDAAK